MLRLRHWRSLKSRRWMDSHDRHHQPRAAQADRRNGVQPLLAIAHDRGCAWAQRASAPRGRRVDGRRADDAAIRSGAQLTVWSAVISARLATAAPALNGIKGQREASEGRNIEAEFRFSVQLW